MKISCVSSVYGKVFHQAAYAWHQRNSKYLSDTAKFHLISLDGETNKSLISSVEYSFINIGKDNKSLAWGDGDLVRLEKVASLCESGSISVHLDLDLALLKDISPILKLPYDFIISRAFAFPKRTVEKIGFVGCTGFYIAKPESLPLINYWIKRIKRKSQVDQQSLNEIFMDLKWSSEKINLDNQEYENAVSFWNNISLLILDSDALPRGMKKQSNKSYGVHNPRVMKEFWKVD